MRRGLQIQTSIYLYHCLYCALLSCLSFFFFSLLNKLIKSLTNVYPYLAAVLNY